MSALRRTAIHRALHRPNLIIGGEREPVLVTAILCGGVAVSALNIVAALTGLGVWLIAIGGWFFRGPDAAGMTPGERNILTARVDDAFHARQMGREVIQSCFVTPICLYH